MRKCSMHDYVMICVTQTYVQDSKSASKHAAVCLKQPTTNAVHKDNTSGTIYRASQQASGASGLLFVLSIQNVLAVW